MKFKVGDLVHYNDDEYYNGFGIVQSVHINYDIPEQPAIIVKVDNISGNADSYYPFFNEMYGEYREIYECSVELLEILYGIQY